MAIGKKDGLVDHEDLAVLSDIAALPSVKSKIKVVIVAQLPYWRCS